MKRTLAFSQTDSLMVLVHGTEAPSDPEWDRWLERWFALFDERGQQCRLLVVTAGGTPTASQRHRMLQRIQPVRGGRTARVALLTESIFARTLVNPLIAMEATWFGEFYRAIRGEAGDSQVYRVFGGQQVRQALTWLELAPAREAEVRRTIADLETEIGRS